jgi:hypothetical protein
VISAITIACRPALWGISLAMRLVIAASARRRMCGSGGSRPKSLAIFWMKSGSGLIH